MKKILLLTFGVMIAAFVAVGWLSEARVTAESVTLTVAITRVVELDCDEGAGEACPNDFYPKFEIGGQGLYDGKDDFCCAHGTDIVIPDWIHTRTVDTGAPVAVHLELWDQDDGSGDDAMDIADGGDYLDIQVNLNNCTWTSGSLSGVLNTTASSQGSGDDSAKIYFFISSPSTSCKDTDNDGLLDVWETSGYDADGNGTIDVNLPAMGASSLRKDLFLELDYLALPGGHTHAPVQAAIQTVVQAFANAPVPNNDGTTGIQLHIDVGPLYGVGSSIAVPGTAGVAGNFGDFGGGNQITEVGNTIVDFDGAPGNAGTSLFTIKNFNANRNNIFRYGLFGHQTNARAATNDCTSGQANAIPGVNFLVTLGGTDGTNPCWGTDASGVSVGSQVQQAGTLMHEFGHVIGLRHGGSDNFNNKPNYLSVMAYRRLQPGLNVSQQSCGVVAVPAFGLPGGCDFSRIALPALNENSLDECQGLDNNVLGLGPIDWNANGALEGVSNCQAPNNSNISANVNLDTSNDLDNDGTWDPGTAENPILANLTGFNDWNAIVYNFRTVFDFTTAVAGDLAQNPEPDPRSIEAARQAAANQIRPQLGMTQSGPSSARPGDTLTYSLSLDNPLSRSARGPAVNVVVTDTRPDLTTQTINVGTVKLQSVATHSISYAVPCSTADGTVLTNSASAVGTDLADNEVRASASGTTTIRAPVLTLSKTATPSVNAGEAITYTISYANTGTGAAAGVTITDTVPAGVYYSVALDQGAGPKPNTVTLNGDGTRTLVWNVGAVAGSSGTTTITFTARPTLLALSGTAFTNRVTLGFVNENGCTYDALNASADTTVTAPGATLNPEGLGFWRNHPELATAEVLARIQATDQTYDTSADGQLSASEYGAALLPGGNMSYVLREEVLTLYFNLATRRVNAGTAIASKLATLLGLTVVRDAALYALETLKLPVISANRARYSNATTAVEEINLKKSLP
jgi:uncharacterized repeat protein (TIGR01451 family)